MLALRTKTNMIPRGIFRPSLLLESVQMFPTSSPTSSCGALRLLSRAISFSPIQCVASHSGDGGKKATARISEVHQFLLEAEERSSAGDDPIPKITLRHVNVSFAGSGKPGGQNFKEVTTKVDVRFNVKNAHWLSDRVRARIMQMEKNRINKDGELVISSANSRAPKDYIEDALEKLKAQMRKLQGIIDSASCVRPPLSEERAKKIAELAALGEQKRLENRRPS